MAFKTDKEMLIEAFREADQLDSFDISPGKGDLINISQQKNNPKLKDLSEDEAFFIKHELWLNIEYHPGVPKGLVNVDIKDGIITTEIDISKLNQKKVSQDLITQITNAARINIIREHSMLSGRNVFEWVNSKQLFANMLGKDDNSPLGDKHLGISRIDFQENGILKVLTSNELSPAEQIGLQTYFAAVEKNLKPVDKLKLSLEDSKGEKVGCFIEDNRSIKIDRLLLDKLIRLDKTGLKEGALDINTFLKNGHKK